MVRAVLRRAGNVAQASCCNMPVRALCGVKGSAHEVGNGVD
jgi:hypothetical protein